MENSIRHLSPVSIIFTDSGSFDSGYGYVVKLMVFHVRFKYLENVNLPRRIA